MDNTVTEIVDFIKRNGDRFTCDFSIGGTLINFKQELTRDVISKNGSLETHFTKLIDRMNPDSITITTKQPNGSTSAGKNPKTRTFAIQNQLPQRETQQLPQSALYGLSGNPLEAGYNFHVGILTEKLAELKEENKELKTDLKQTTKERDKLLVKVESSGEKKKWKEKQFEIQQANSLGSIVKENMPEIKELVLDLAGKRKEEPAEAAIGLEGLPQQKTILIELVKQLKEGNQLDFYNETLIRMAQLEGEPMQRMIDLLRELTPQCNEHFGIE